MEYPSTLTPHYREHSISQLSLVSFDVYCQPVLFTFAFSQNILPANSINARQELVYLPLYNILRVFLTTTPRENNADNISNVFLNFQRTFIEILIGLDILESTFPESNESKSKEVRV